MGMNGMRVVVGLRLLTSDESFHKPFTKSTGMATVNERL